MEYKEVRYIKFLGEDVRIVDYGYHKRFMVKKDMFKALGKLKTNGDIIDNDNIKYKELIDDLELEEGKDYINKLMIKVKISDPLKKGGTSKARNTQQVDLINIVQVPIMLTQFKPTKKAKDYDNKLKIWRDFMKFINSILQDYHMEDYIIEDKEEWKRDTLLFNGDEKVAMIANRQTNINMAKILGVYNQGIKYINKNELKKYNSQTTMDLLAIRQELYHEYSNLYSMFESKKIAMVGSLNKIIKKYKLEIELEKV